MSAIYMGTTAISPQRTAGEIQELLARAGAKQIAIEYKESRIIALRWTMDVFGADVCFLLPVRVDPVYKLMCRKMPRSRPDLAQAERTAWRQVLRWTEAQLALIETGMVSPAEPFTPYAQNRFGESFYQMLEPSRMRAIAAPGAN